MPTTKSIALFDFDKTIVNKDIGFEFVVYALKNNIFRLLLAIPLFPLAFLSYISVSHRYIGNSFFLWVSTFALSPKKIIKLRREFITDYFQSPRIKVYPDALAKIKHHHRAGDKIIIASGASRWMVIGVLRKLKINNILVNDILVVGSKEKYYLTGMICTEHCYSSNKKRMIQRRVKLDSYPAVTGYSDSSADIPMLSLCNVRYLINPSNKSLSKYKKTFRNDFKLLKWS